MQVECNLTIWCVFSGSDSRSEYSAGCPRVARGGPGPFVPSGALDAGLGSVHVRVRVHVRYEVHEKCWHCKARLPTSSIEGAFQVYKL